MIAEDTLSVLVPWGSEEQQREASSPLDDVSTREANPAGGTAAERTTGGSCTSRPQLATPLIR